MGAEFTSAPGIALGGGPLIRPVQLRVGDVSYLLRVTEQGWGPEHQREVRFLGYHVGGQIRQFTNIPYEDDAFSWAAHQFFLVDTTVVLDIVGGETLVVDQSALHQVDSAQIVGPVWCPIANMRKEHPSGPGGNEVQHGSKHFAVNAKLYCFPSLWGDGYEHIQVVGRHRGSHRYVTMIISSSWLVNWRVKLVYSPHVIHQLWPFWNGTERAKSQVEELVEAMRYRQQRTETNAPGIASTLEMDPR